jgi:hypothetical protein
LFWFWSNSDLVEPQM